MEYQVEYDSSLPVRFLDPRDVKMYDAFGNEMEIPKCECGSFKSQLIGKEYFKWICNSCFK